MKILSPMERQNIQYGRQALFKLPEAVKRDESAEAKPLDYVEPYRGAKLGAVTVDEASLATNGFGVPVVKPRYTGNNLEVEARIAKEMQYRDDFEKKMDEMEDNEPIFHPTSLSAFVSDHRIMRKGPWK